MGSRVPTESIAFRKASSKSSPRQPTSPVEAHLHAKRGVGPLQAREGKLRRLDAHVVQLQEGGQGRQSTGAPMITRVARSMRLRL